MGFLSRLLSFERPMGPTLVQLLYYIGLIWILWVCVAQIVLGVANLADDFGAGVWQIVSAPLLAILSALVLRLLAEGARALFRIDASLHDVATGRAAPPGSMTRPSPDQSPD